MSPAPPPAAHQIAESSPSLVNVNTGGVREHGSEHTDDCQRAKVLAALLLVAKPM